MAKKKGGFWRGILIFLLGSACGTGSIAAVSVYLNDLHLPFVKEQSKTHLPVLSSERKRNEREAVEFQSILRQQNPLPITEEAANTSTPRRFVYYLQIGAFQENAIAEDLRGRVILNGHQATINTGTLADGNSIYRVWIGPYNDEDSAEEKRAELTLEGYADVHLLQTAQQ
ncbi:MAG: SPOR domain-containing protein [Proteobacteria bacterium]|nr:SPOR domain-containing protein [Pseudomonadota bacterium]MCH9758220.1 SPOR domain-containing protein [Pseudomonadota bacterium]